MAYEITKGATPRPVKACVYGPEGVGKTTFAASWPDAVFIDVEDGSGHYDVARLPRPTSWIELIEEVAAASHMPEVGTLVIDTADAAEALCISSVLFDKKWKSIEDAGYGKGYTYLAERFQELIRTLDLCANRGKNVLVVAHAQIKRFAQPDELGEYDRWELKLQKKCAPLIKEWADLLLFANYKTDTMKDDNGKYRATGGKKRMMYASHTAAYDAKNRLGLPDEMPFAFESIAEAIPKAQDLPKEEQEPRKATAENAKLPDFEEVTEPEIKQLHQLMADYGINDAQLRDAVGSRKNNPYTDATPIGDYTIEFVRDTLLAHWEAIVATIKERGEVFDGIPF